MSLSLVLGTVVKCTPYYALLGKVYSVLYSTLGVVLLEGRRTKTFFFVLWFPGLFDWARGGGKREGEALPYSRDARFLHETQQTKNKRSTWRGIVPRFFKLSSSVSEYTIYGVLGWSVSLICGVSK